MRKSVIVVLFLLLVLMIPASSMAGPVHQGQVAPIRLKTAVFTPAQGEKPDIPPGLTIAGYTAGQRGYYIVQFEDAIESALKERVTDVGAELLSYIPDNAFKVRMNPGQANRVGKLEGIAWVGLFHPAYKLNPGLADDGLFTVRIERGADAGLVTAAITRSGAEILAREDSILLIAADAVQLEAIAHVTDVAWVENFQMKETHNEYGAGSIMQSAAANANGYDGSTQIVAVADTGLGGGTATTAHADIPSSRITAIFDWPASDARNCYYAHPDGAQDVDSGHGTHTSLSVLSDGDAAGLGKGTAPAASLVFQSVEDYVDMYRQCGSYEDGYYLMGLPDDIRNLFQQAYGVGARVHSNSWGSDAAGDYTLDSANTDDFIWDNPDMTITFSAGNAGVDGNNDGYVDEDSMGSPATAKNVITVGASENDRDGNWDCDTSLSYTDCAAQGGQNNLFTYGEAWPDDYAPGTVIGDDPSAGNAQQLAAFSSRGPTDDGRIKPDVVAPGTWVLSGYADPYQEGYDGSPNPVNGLFQYDGWGFPYNQVYKYMGGTSMSNPLTAGAAAVVRDYYQKAHGLNASAALVKATLINSAVDLLDENNDGADDNDFPIPNNHEGWGLVNLSNATDGSHQFVENAGIGTGNTAVYNYSVNNGGSFKVSLVWSDYPSTETAAANLVNDLNLKVTAPGGAVYLGNVFSGGWSATGGSADNVNNVENVYVQSASAGTWTVEVSGSNVPQGPQPFALVVDGVFGGTVDTPPTVNITNPADGATVADTVIIIANASDDNGVTQVEFFVDGASIGVDTNEVNGWSASWNTTAFAEGGHIISATATDTIGQTGSDSISVTVDNIPTVDDPPTVTITNPTDGTTVSSSVNVTADTTDDNGVTQVEFFVGENSIGVDTDAADGWSASWDTTGYANGGYTVSVTATDTIGQTASDSVDVTVDNVIITDTMHVSAIDMWYTRTGRNYNIYTQVTVVDASNNPVANATVDVLVGTTSSTAVTGSDGTVTFSLKTKTTGTYTATVTDVSHATLIYDAGANIETSESLSVP